MSPVLATIPEDVARKVADDIATYGRGCVVFDREGRARFVPSYAVIEPMDAEPERRTFE